MGSPCPLKRNKPKKEEDISSAYHVFVVAGAVQGALLMGQQPAMVPSWSEAFCFAWEIGKPWGDVCLCHLQHDHAVARRWFTTYGLPIRLHQCLRVLKAVEEGIHELCSWE